MLPVLQPSRKAAPVVKTSGSSDKSDRRLSDRSVALAGLGRLALRSPKTKVLFDETVQLLALTLRVEFAEILQLLPSEDRLLMVAGVGWKKGTVGSASVPAGSESHAGFAIGYQSALVVKDLAKEKRFQKPGILTKHKVVSGVSLLIGTELEPWGILGVHTRQRRTFSGRDVHFLQAVSHILSEAITRQRAEAKLRDREHRLRLVTDAMPALISYIDHDLVYRYCNARYTEWFGIEEKDIIGKSIHEVMGTEAFQTIEPSIRLALNGKRAVLEANLPYQHGPRRDVHIEYIPHLARNKEVLGFYSMIVDLTDRVHAEATRGWLASIVEHSNDAIVGKTLEGIVTSWNAAAERMFGYRPEEIIGKSVEVLFPPDRKQEMHSILARVAQGEAVNQEEAVRLRKDGTLLDVLVTISPIRGEKNQILGASSIAHDISERKRVEAQKQEWAERLQAQLAINQSIEESLRHSNRELEEFTGIVTHDLRTPLASALFTGELLRETFRRGDLEQTENLVDLVLQSLWQMDELIKELHSQALVRSSIDQQEVDLEEVLLAAQERASVLLEKTEGRLVKKGKLPTITGNPTMLAQLFSNLIENAIKYRCAEPPLIRVDADSNDRHHIVTFRDNGRGVPEEDRERVFMPRERGSNVGTTPGSGLGLALCRKIMQAHGGTISVSTSEAGGAAFDLLFPRKLLQKVVATDVPTGFAGGEP